MPLRKNPLAWLALAVVLGGTAIGLQGHFWIAIAADFAAVGLALAAKFLTRRRKRP